MRILPVISILVAASSYPCTSIGSEGGAGARGGGTGIVCEAESKAITLEEFEIRQAGAKSELPSTRAEIAAWLEQKLKSDPSLLREVRAQWTAIGDYDTWPIQSEALNLKSSDEEAIDHEFSRLLANLLPKLSVPARAGVDQELMHDDFAGVPVGCRKVQLGLIVDGRIFRVNQAWALSDHTKRVLELHEALYLAGMRFHAHRLPIRARRLITVAATGNEKDLQREIKAFVRKPNEKKLYSGLNSILLLTSHTDNGRQCPIAMSFAYDGDQQRSLSLEFHGGSLEVRSRKPLTLPSQAVTRVLQGDWVNLEKRFPAFYFPDTDGPLAPGRVNTFAYDQSRNEYSLELRGWNILMYGQVRFPPKVFPEAYARRKDEAPLPQYCYYRAWVPDAPEVDPASLVKIWNRRLLSLE